MNSEKFCQRCRVWQSKDNFSWIAHEFGYRKDRLCFECREIKKALREASAIQQRASRPCAIREKELTLIPNPFEKMTRVHIQDYSHFINGETV